MIFGTGMGKSTNVTECRTGNRFKFMNIWEKVCERVRGGVTNQKGSINHSVNCIMEIDSTFKKTDSFPKPQNKLQVL